MKYKYLSNQSMNIRPAANVNNSPIGSLPANTVGQGDELVVLTNGDKWLKILTGGNAVGWVAAIHNGKVYGTITENDVTQPTDPVTTFPESFILTDPATGKRAEFAFVREL